MKGTAEVGIKVKVICSRCGRDLRVDVRDGVGNVSPEIEVDPCEWCEEEARQESVEEARQESVEEARQESVEEERQRVGMIQPADDKCECPFCGKSWKPFKVEMNKEAKL